MFTSRQEEISLLFWHFFCVSDMRVCSWKPYGEPWESYQIAGGEFDRTIAPLHVSNEVILQKSTAWLVLRYSHVSESGGKQKHYCISSAAALMWAVQAALWCGLSKVQDVMRSRPDEFISYLYTPACAFTNENVSWATSFCCARCRFFSLWWHDAM